jgi:Cu(I)/Ag(I) efflux system membrane fusion protein
MSLASLLLAVVGCATTYKFSSPSPGHPANPNIEEPVHERSMALTDADTVDPRPAQSYQWTAQRHENTGHHGSTETSASVRLSAHAEGSVEPLAEVQHQKKEESAPETKDADRHQHKEHEELEHKTEKTQQRAPDDFENQFAQVLQGYFETVDALAADDFRTATKKMELVQSRLKQVEPKLLEEAKREQWKQIYELADRMAQQFLNAPNIEAARTAFAPISEQMEKAVRAFGSGGLAPVYRLHCPMAGAYWLQPREQVNNPYYGERMLRCGSVTDTLVPETGNTKKPNHDH